MQIALEPVTLPLDKSMLPKFLNQSHVAYMAHPYGGDFSNILRARNLARRINKQYPNLVLFNPLDNMQYMDRRPESDILYAEKYILAKCDFLLLTPGWRYSPGCQSEYEAAYKSYGIPVIEIDESLTPKTLFLGA